MVFFDGRSMQSENVFLSLNGETETMINDIHIYMLTKLNILGINSVTNHTFVSSKIRFKYVLIT